MEERIYARYMSDVAYFLSRLEAEPESYYFIPIALAYNKLKKYDETISLCRTGLEHFPSNCAAKVLLAEAYVYTGETDYARDLLFDVLTEDGDNYKALKLLGIIYQSLEMNDEAVKYFRGAYLRSPEDTELKKLIEDLGSTVDIDDIISDISGRGPDSDSEEDEEAKTFLEIERKIKNAELVMADLVADKTIMGPKRSSSEPESNLVSDDELEKLIAMASAPAEPAPIIQDEIAPPESVFIDDDLAKLMNGSGDFPESDTVTEQESLPFDDELPSSFDQDYTDNLPADDDSLLDSLSSEDESQDDDLLSALNNQDDSLLDSLPSEDESQNDDLLSALNNQDDSLLDSLPSEDESQDDDLSGVKSDFINNEFSVADMISDDEESYNDDESDQNEYKGDIPNIDLGDSAPFVQGDILNEIFEASGIDSEEESQDELSETDELLKEKSKKQQKIEKLEAKLNKIRQRKNK